MRYAVLALACPFFAISPAGAQTVQPAAPIDRPAPEYPDAANNIEGYVKLRFTVAKDGHVKDAAVTDSNPSGVFDAAAMATVKLWVYRPRLVDGQPADQPGNTITLRFKPDLSPQDNAIWLNPSPPQYPRPAYDAKVEGAVTVGFDLSEIGTTENVHVLTSSAPGVFDQAATEDVNNRVYKPMIVNGKPQAVSGLAAVIAFNLKDARIAPKLVHRVVPQYPSEAENQWKIGFCAIDFTIEHDGSVSNPVVVASFPRGLFERNSLAAIKGWRYEPAKDVGGPVASEGRMMFNYRMEGQSQRDTHYLKPGQWVNLEFTLTVSGSPKDVKVVGQSDPDLPTGRAVEQIKHMHFAPIIENGVPVEKEHQLVKID